MGKQGNNVYKGYYNILLPERQKELQISHKNLKILSRLKLLRNGTIIDQIWKLNTEESIENRHKGYYNIMKIGMGINM